MDMRAYFRKLKDAEERIPTKEAVVISEGTDDGGVAGVPSEVKRATAARLIVDGRARMATDEEAEQYRAEMREAKQQADEEYEALRAAYTVAKVGPMRPLKR